jgi:hypothetical protein
MNERPAPARSDQDLAGSGLPVLEGVLARFVDIEGVMSVLECRNAEAAPLELGDELYEEGRLPGPAPSG